METKQPNQTHELKTLHFAKGFKEQATVGRFNVSRYHGEFTVDSLQIKADLGLWYARASGTGLGIEGEGETVELAIADMQKRAAGMLAELRNVYGV